MSDRKQKKLWKTQVSFSQITSQQARKFSRENICEILQRKIWYATYNGWRLESNNKGTIWKERKKVELIFSLSVYFFSLYNIYLIISNKCLLKRNTRFFKEGREKEGNLWGRWGEPKIYYVQNKTQNKILKRIWTLFFRRCFRFRIC